MPEAALDLNEILESLQAALAAEEAERSWQVLEPLSFEDQRWCWARLDEDERGALVRLLEREDLAELVLHLAEAQAVELLEDLPPAEAAHIVEDLPE
ncbi:MAG: hypothetical protein KDK99_22165, partial [Verrucomicrobiales bacterium]|nr:hypothetical protein [Verrucomicrobiales bacterium]